MNRTHFHRRPTEWTLLHIWLASVLTLALFSSAQAQRRGGFGGGGGGFPTPEESFQRMDRNQNGQIDPDELQQLPSFLRDGYTRAGLDLSRPISQKEFIESSQQMREQFERSRANGDSPFRSSGGGGSSRGGPPGDMRPSSGESERRETPRAEEPEERETRRDDRRRRDERDSESRDSSSSSKSTAKKDQKEKKPKSRVTKDLPEDYRERDKNGDGQIGLYEWDRQAFAKFFELDRNGDGLLTPDELVAPPKSEAAGQSAGASRTTRGAISPTASANSVTKAAATSKASPSASQSPSKSSATTTATATDNSPGAIAFQSLDVNKDGQITQEEWERSRNTRQRFEKLGIKVTMPIKQTPFVELYRKTEGT